MKQKKCMKLKTRIVVAFLAIIIIPFLLTAVVLCWFANSKIRALGEEYGIKEPTYESLYNSSLAISKRMDAQFAKLQTMAEENPDQLEDNSCLNRLNAELTEDDSCIAVRKEDRIYYNGSTVFTDEQLLQTLPAYGEGSAVSGSRSYIETEAQVLVKQMDFRFRDGSDGSIFLISQLNQILPETQDWLFDTVVAILLILVLTSLAMSLWIYRGVVSPLNQLKKATQNIKEGNLDFTVEGNGVKEVNDLCEDFEEMRKRLKESAEEKVEFDRDNKELISNISHDLKTPITAVKGYVEGLMDGVADTPEKVDRYIHTIYNKANEMDRLINELTFYSKIDTNRIPYTFAKIHVADYFEDCVEELSYELKAQGIDLTYFNYLDEDVLVIADAEQLKRVINNIVSNSIKYMNKEKGVINIRLKDAGDFIQV